VLANLTSTISLLASEGGSKDDFADLHVAPWVWAAFLSVVVILLIADLLLVHLADPETLARRLSRGEAAEGPTAAW